MTKTVVKRQNGIRSYVLGVMSYMGILCFVPLIASNKDEFVRFHARQGLVIWVWSILAVLSLYLPGVGKLIFSTSAMGVVVISLIGVISVLLKRAWKIPFIYALANKI